VFVAIVGVSVNPRGEAMKYKTIFAGLGLLLSLLTTCVQSATWQLGLPAESSRSPFVGARQETSVMPLVNYIGDRFSYLGGELRYGLTSGADGEIYALGQLRPRQFYSASPGLDDDLQIEGMQDRKPAFELGLGMQRQTAFGSFQLQGFLDASGSHDGYELSASYGYPRQIGRWLIEPVFGLQLQSNDLADYYHGVMDSEARSGRPSYTADEALNILASLTIGYTINPRLLAIGGIEQLNLDTSISDSPIVSEQQIRKVYLGVIYTF
jgi:outer membrane protein